jgi:hypothetical protein
VRYLFAEGRVRYLLAERRVRYLFAKGRVHYLCIPPVTCLKKKMKKSNCMPRRQKNQYVK